jgi:hypothetical protein
MPKLCEKCGNYDPTPRLTADSRCPRCGVIYAKLAQSSVRAVSTPVGLPTDVAEPSFMADEPGASWPPPKPFEVWLSVAAVCMLFAILLLDDDGFVLLLDHANLAFHEAGHLFFGVLGSTLGLYGGTLGQLVFPIVAGTSFWRRRQAVGVALSGVWLFENFLNIARYMADARAQLLPLVGGGEHDWYHIFSRWGLLNRDTDIAALTQMLGWLGMIGCMLWLWRRSSAERHGQDKVAGVPSRRLKNSIEES